MSLRYLDPRRDKVNQKPKQLYDFLLRRAHRLLVRLYTNVKAQTVLTSFLDLFDFGLSLLNRIATNFK